jgi:hypothetical protein
MAIAERDSGRLPVRSAHRPRPHGLRHRVIPSNPRRTGSSVRRRNRPPGRLETARSPGRETAGGAFRKPLTECLGFLVGLRKIGGVLNIRLRRRAADRCALSRARFLQQQRNRALDISRTASLCFRPQSIPKIQPVSSDSEKVDHRSWKEMRWSPNPGQVAKRESRP